MGLVMMPISFYNYCFNVQHLIGENLPGDTHKHILPNYLLRGRSSGFALHNHQTDWVAYPSGEVDNKSELINFTNVLLDSATHCDDSRRSSR